MQSRRKTKYKQTIIDSDIISQFEMKKQHFDLIKKLFHSNKLTAAVNVVIPVEVSVLITDTISLTITISISVICKIKESDMNSNSSQKD